MSAARAMTFMSQLQRIEQATDLIALDGHCCDSVKPHLRALRGISPRLQPSHESLVIELIPIVESQFVSANRSRPREKYTGVGRWHRPDSQPRTIEEAAAEFAGLEGERYVRGKYDGLLAAAQHEEDY